MLQHKGTQVIETPRLILRPFTMADADAMFHNWANDAEVCRYLTWVPHANVEETQKIVEFFTNGYSQPNHYMWAVVYKPDNTLVGNISMVDMDENTCQGTVGYCYSRAYWGKNIATEALQAVLDYWFSCGFVRIVSHHHISNPASGRVMEKCGLQYEGIGRKSALDNQRQYCDVHTYAIIDTDPRPSLV